MAERAIDYSCSPGHDQKCVDIYGEGSCCFWAFVEDVPDNRTLAQKAFDIERLKRGWPINKGEQALMCNDQYTVD
jgi:hypothetical protein